MKSWVILTLKKCYPTTLSISLHREPYIPVFHFISYLADHQIQTVKGNIFRGVFWDMKGWWADLCSRKILSYYTQKQSSERVLQIRFSWNFHEIHRNTGAAYCLFLFIENLTLTSSISFPVNMERSKRTTNRIGHLSS